VDIYLGRGELLRRELKHADARAEYEAALSLLSDLARAGAGKARLDPVRAEVLHKLGELSGAQGRRREALRYYRQALPIRQALSDGGPDDPGFRRDLARNYGYMGDVQLELGDAAGAKASYDQAAAIRQENVDRAAGPGELLLAKCQRARDFGNMAAYFAWTGKPGEAVEWHQRRLDYYNGAPFPQDGPLEGAFRTDRADCRAALADLLLDLGRQAEARPPLDEALMEYKQLLSRDPESTELKAGEAYALLVRGKALVTAGKNAEASRAIGRVRAALEDLLAAARATPQPENEYRLAVANAWLGLLEPDAVSAAVSNDRAMTALSNAVKGGFLDLERLGREGGFRRLREGERTREAFRDLVRQLTTAREPG
jgi:tetratricopeptide (TPR) repeat protein